MNSWFIFRVYAERLYDCLTLNETNVWAPTATIDEQIALLEKLRKQRTATNRSCQNCVHCQRIVSEEELPNLLAQGWRVSAVLSSGKVVVEL